MSLRRKALILALSVGLPACDPYKNLDGDYYFGPIDPGCPANAAQDTCTPFPPDVQGTMMPNSGNVAGGGSVLYYPVQVAAAYAPGGANPLELRREKGATITDRAQVYVFDTAPGQWNGQNTNKCTPPSANYIYDARKDDFPLNQQFQVFQQKQISANTAVLPNDSTKYQAVFAEVPVQSGSFSCQSIHSADGLIDQNGKNVNVTTVPAPVGSPFFRAVGVGDGFYRALAVIDPATDVYTIPDPDGACPPADQDMTGMCHNPVTHLGPQQFAFFDHFLIAYLDGGYVPTTMKTTAGTMGAPDTIQVLAQENTIYAPDTFLDADGMPQNCGPALDPTSIGFDCLGHGMEFIDGVGGKIAQRNAANTGYSPICHIIVFTPVDPAVPITNPMDPAQVDMTTAIDAGGFIYCLQLQ